jgi:DNA fragmentation factor, 45 kD, alpha subunit
MDATDSCADGKKVHLKNLVGQLKSNMCNISLMQDQDLEILANMDPNSVAEFDITGNFIEQLKEASGRLEGETI